MSEQDKKPGREVLTNSLLDVAEDGPERAGPQGDEASGAPAGADVPN